MPPKSFGCATVFLENVLRWKRDHELFLFCDKGEDYGGVVSPLSNPPESLAHHLLYNDFGQRRPAAISNAVWLASLRILDANKVTHFIYLESDCRVNGHYWDEKMFKEYFSYPVTPIAAGTMCSFNSANGGYDYYRRWIKWISEMGNRKHPITVMGAPPVAKEKREPALYVNGALGVYSMDWMKKIFDLKNSTETVTGKAWDYVIGEKVYSMFGLDSFELIRHMDTIYSGYSNDLTTEDQRMDWLMKGKAIAVHQIKSQRTVPNE